jgi:hypothetical protein
MVTQQQRKNQGQRAMSSTMSSVSDAMSKPTEMVQEYPVSSMLVVFGIGMGIGVALSQALIPAFHEPTMSERMTRQLYDGMNDLTSTVKRSLHLA